MKYAYILIISFVMLTLFSCKKSYPGDSYNFTNSTLPYAELKTKAFTVQQSKNVKITVRVKTVFAVPTTVNYNLGGVLTGTGSITIPANLTEGSASIMIPAAIVPVGETSVEGTLTLTTAQNANTQLKIGYLNSVDEVAVITITP